MANDVVNTYGLTVQKSGVHQCIWSSLPFRLKSEYMSPSHIEQLGGIIRFLNHLEEYDFDIASMCMVQVRISPALYFVDYVDQ